MASTYTDLLKFNKPGLGDTGWGTAVNSGFTDMAEQALTGVVSKAVTAGSNTLAAIASGAPSEARNQFILLIGSLTGPASLTVPAGTATNYKLYFVKNTAGDAVTITDGVSGVVVPNGKSMVLRVTSTGVEEAVTHAITLSVGTLTLTNALGATAGGTGQTVYAVGDLLYANTTTTLSKLTAGATNAVLTVAAGIPAWVTTLPVASGGTGAATLTLNNVLLGNGTSAVQTVAPGTAGNVLTSVGGTWASAVLPASYVGPNIQIFTGNGTFNVPSGITKVKATVVGGGGLGGNFTSGVTGEGAAGGGGGGAVAVKWVTVTSGGSYSVTVGGSGANSVFDSITSACGATGGTGSVGVFAAGGAGGAVTDTSSWPGFASSGSAGVAGASNGSVGVGGAGGISGAASFGEQFKWGSGASSNTSGTGATAGSAGSTYGGGGSGAARGSGSGGASGGAGAQGVVIIEW